MSDFAVSGFPPVTFFLVWLAWIPARGTPGCSAGRKEKVGGPEGAQQNSGESPPLSQQKKKKREGQGILALMNHHRLFMTKRAGIGAFSETCSEPSLLDRFKKADI